MKCIRCGKDSTQVYCPICEKTYGKPASICTTDAALLQNIQTTIKKEQTTFIVGELRSFGEWWKRYEGDLQNDLPEGKGIIYAINGQKVYEGEFHEGKRNGKGIYFWPNGTKMYKGTWQDDKFLFGTCFYPDGRQADSVFGDDLRSRIDTVFDFRMRLLPADAQKENEVRNGYGIKELRGGRYIGELHDGKCNGFGIFLDMDGDKKYAGEWQDGVRHGYGREYVRQYTRLKNGDSFEWGYKDVVRYEGNWVNDLYDGYGIFYDLERPLCKMYKGEWKNGMRSGYGTSYFSDTNRKFYEGEWKEDKRHGFGIDFSGSEIRRIGGWRYGEEYGYGVRYFHDKYVGEEHDGKKSQILHYDDGRMKYIGPLSGGKPNGKGVLFIHRRVHCDVVRYEGEFQNGKLHGHGTLFLPNGECVEGEFINNTIQGYTGILQ